MCLSNISQLKIATRDIIVYKIIWELKDHTSPDSSHYETLHYRGEVTFNTLLKSKIVVEYDASVTVGFHSYKYLRDAKLIAEKHNKLSQPIVDRRIIACHVTRCIIPKRSKYHVGITKIFSNSFESFASNRIKYLKIIKTYKI